MELVDAEEEEAEVDREGQTVEEDKHIRCGLSKDERQSPAVSGGEAQWLGDEAGVEPQVEEEDS